jgi:serine/threonine protein kinase
MARVDLAEDTVLGRPVALKRVAGAADDHGLSRLRREALAGASLSHTNLVSVYDVVTSDEGQLVIVMEYIVGGTLRDALNERRRLPADEALRVLAGIAAGLDAIHERGIVHRDVKPSNILLGDGGAVKVADLGIAALPDRTRITASGSVLGSLSYMAPEQLDNAPSTPAIDIYALAAVAYEVLSGEKARRETNPVTLAHAIATQAPPNLRNAWAEAPPGAADLLVRGMARDPAERPRTAGELVGRLRTALAPERRARTPRSIPVAVAAADLPTRPHRAAGAGGGGRGPRDPGHPPPARPPAEPPRRSRMGPLLAALLALAAALVVLAVLLNSSGSSPRRAAHTASTHRHHTAPAPAKSTSSSSTTTASSTASAAPAPASSATPSATSSTTPSSTTSSRTAPAAPPPPAGSPAAAVESFYGAAAAHQYAAAWALADPTLRSELDGYRSFQQGQAGDRSITFNNAKVVSQSSRAATVAVQTTSVRDSGTSHCTGTVDLVPAGGQWRLHLVHINCS